MNAKQFLQRQLDNTVGKAFVVIVSILLKMVNDSASLSENQQGEVLEAVRELLEVGSDFRPKYANRKHVLPIATYINSCHD